MAGLSFDKREGKIWYNGAFHDWQDVNLHVLSHGLHYGRSVFEGNRAYGGEIFKLEEHTDRLFNSAKILGFEIPYSKDEINQACKDSLTENGIVDGYLRPVAWSGSEMMAISAQHNTIHVAIASWEWPSYFSPEERMAGIRLDFADWRRPSPDSAPFAAKAAGLYMICTMSKHAAEERGFTDALMLDHRGRIAEATGANVFFVKNGELHTPDPDCFLDGITRRTIIDLAKRRNIKVVERAIMPEELADMQEVFLVGTAAEVTPVSQIADYSFQAGQITETLMNDYMDLVNGRL